MNKRMREILATIEEKQSIVKEHTESKDFDAAESVLNEIDTLMKEYSVEERMESMAKAEVDVEAVEKSAEVDSIKAFAQAARSGFKTLNEGTNSQGGYTVPEDISTQIQELRAAKASLLDLVTVESVQTLSGARTFKARANQTGFTQVGEGNNITKTSQPSFSRLTYSIKKYAGYFPVTNELLDDTDANLVGTLMNWIADESRVTANKLILAALDAKYTRNTNPETAVTLDHLDDIKNILNVTLGQAFKATSVIVTNDSGLQILDTLKDDDGDYLLKTNPQDPMKMVFSAGATTVPVVVIPNADLANDSNNGAPFYVGDIKEAIVYFDRKLMDIKVSDVAAIGDLNAWEDDLTIYRAIEREDVVVRDEAAYVKGFWSFQ